MDDELAEHPPLARLFFQALWCLADYKGDIEWSAKRLKIQTLPYDECDIEQFAINLDKSGFIRFYSDGEKIYLHIRQFVKHQNPHKNERDKGSEIPAYSEKLRQLIDLEGLTINRDLSRQDHDDNGTDPADSLFLIPDSRSLIADDGEAQAPHANDNRERFEMFNGWTPSLDQHTEKALQNAGITQADFDEQLPKYIASVIDKGSQRTQHEWSSGFKSSLMRFANSQKTFKRPMRKTLEQKAQEFIHG